jgi:hypothetical protein
MPRQRKASQRRKCVSWTLLYLPDLPCGGLPAAGPLAHSALCAPLRTRQTRLRKFPSIRDFIYLWPGYGPSSGATSNYRSADLLSLSIELQPDSTISGNKLRAWELRLTIPKSADRHGQITIDCGGGSKRTFSLSKLALGAHTCNVDTNAEDFGAIWVSPEVHPEYKAVVEDRIPGLDREQATLFASSTSRLKPRVDRVLWGGSYYLVWHTTHEIRLPRSVIAQPLAPTAQWNCAFITLPDDEDSEVKRWIDEATAVAISPQRRVFGVLYPPPCGLDILGRLIVPAGEPLVVGLRQTESDADTTVAFRATADNACAQVSLEGAGRHLVCIEQGSSRAQIAIQLNEAALPLIVPTSISDTDVFPHVRFVAREISSRGSTEASLGTKRGLALLEKVRRGNAELSEFTMPSGLKGAIRWRRPTDIAWSSAPLGRDGDRVHIIAGPDELARLNKTLQDRRYEIEIDFGSFGVFRASPGGGRASSFAISRTIRNRIQWLAAASLSLPNKRGTLFHHLTDAELAQFASQMRAAPQLAAHHRALMAELQRLSRGRAGR